MVKKLKYTNKQIGLISKFRPSSRPGFIIPPQNGRIYLDSFTEKVDE